MFKDLFFQIVEASPNVISVVDPDGRLIYVNKVARDFFQIPADLVLPTEADKNFDNIAAVHPEQSGKKILEIGIPTALKFGQWTSEVQVWKAGASRVSVPMEQVIIGHRDERGQLLFISSTLRDLSDQKERHAQMLQTSKMVALGEMSSGIAHEINNPLSIIVGRATQLKKLISATDVDRAKANELVEKIEGTAHRISKIIRGLRSFSRSGEGEPYIPVPLKQIVEETLDLSLERFKNHGVNVVVAPVPEIVLHCRPVQLEQVLLNLLNNAFDAVSELSQKWIHLDFEADAEGMSLRITDSGSGIPDAVVDKMMMPFFTTKQTGKGTGLGLSISKGILEDHGGSLRYNRTSEHTQFVIWVPYKFKAVQKTA